MAGLDGWKKLAGYLTSISEKLKPAGLRAGYHNHPIEFTPIDGKRPIDVIAANTPKEVMLQLCVGACVGANADPVAFIKANPGRVRHIHSKDWAPGPGYNVAFGEGVSPWPQIFAAAESVGRVFLPGWNSEKEPGPPLPCNRPALHGDLEENEGVKR